MRPIRTTWISPLDTVERGGQVNLARLLTNLDRRRNLAQVLLPGCGPLHQLLTRAGIDCVWPLPPRSVPGRRDLPWWCRPAYLRVLWSALRFQPHVVYVDATWQLPFARRLADHCGARLLWHAQAVPMQTEERDLILHADHAVAVAPHLAEFVRTLAPRLPVSCVPNAVDTDRFVPGVEPSLRAELGAAPDEPVILHVGTLEPVKGVDTLIEAFARVLTRAPSAWLWLVGGGTEVDRMKRLVSERGLEARIRFAGVRQDVERFYRAATLFVLASHTEGMPLSLLEAMSSATTCLASDIPATRDLLPPDAGVCVPPRDPERLAEAILDLLASPERRTSLGTAARERVLQGHGLSRYVEDFSHTLAEIAGQGGQS